MELASQPILAISTSAKQNICFDWDEVYCPHKWIMPSLFSFSLQPTSRCERTKILVKIAYLDSKWTVSDWSNVDEDPEIQNVRERMDNDKTDGG